MQLGWYKFDFVGFLVTKFSNEEWDLALRPQDGIYLHTLHSGTNLQKGGEENSS